MSPSELVQQRRRRRDGQPQQRRFELTERMSAREHVDHVPALGPRDRAATERRHEAGSDHRGLPRARRPDDGEEPRAGLILLEPADAVACVTASRPKKSAASASRNARSPLYGLRISPAGTVTLDASPRMRSADGRGQLEGVGESILRVLGGRAPDRAIERGRQIGARPPGPTGSRP